MTRINRREFIRMASLMGGVSLFAGCSLFGEGASVPEYIKGAPATDPVEKLKGVQNIYTVCGLCAGNCGICCRIAEGALVKIGGNPFHPISSGSPLAFDTPLDQAITRSGSVCAIGGSGVQTLYDPFRVVKPLKRVGERGSAKWASISWKQAINEIVRGGDLFGEGTVAGLRQVKDSKEGLGLYLGRTDLGSMSFLSRFLKGFTAATVMRDKEVRLADLSRQVAESVFGPGAGIVAADLSNARCMISFGDAPLDTGVPLVSIGREIAEARVTSSCLNWAVVDPRLSTSGSKADLWVPVIPGKDLELAMGVMRSLFDRHAGLVRISDSPLRTAVMSRPAREYARACGVSSRIMDQLADMLAASGPRSAVIPGKGILAAENGREAAEAILTLNLMVGSVPGSGGLLSRNDGFLDDALKSLSGGSGLDDTKSASFASAKAWLLWNADPVYDERERMSQRLRSLKEIPLLVALDTQITETTALADYILPDTTYLERWDICPLPVSVKSSGVGVRKPVVGGFDSLSRRYFPVFPETRLMEDILIDVAVNLGLPGFGEKAMEASGNLLTAWDYYSVAIPAVLGAMKQQGFPISGSGKDFENVVERGGFFPSADRLRAGEPQKPTVTRPWQPSTKTGPAISSPPGYGADEFMLVTYALPFHRGPRAGINRWLLEVMPENRLLINNADALQLGIRQGDLVDLEMGDSKARVQCKAHVLPGIMPGVVALADGFGYQQCGASAQTIDNSTRATDKAASAGLSVTALLSETRTVKVKKA